MSAVRSQPLLWPVNGQMTKRVRRGFEPQETGSSEPLFCRILAKITKRSRSGVRPSRNQFFLRIFRAAFSLISQKGNGPPRLHHLDSLVRPRRNIVLQPRAHGEIRGTPPTPGACALFAKQLRANKDHQGFHPSKGNRPCGRARQEGFEPCRLRDFCITKITLRSARPKRSTVP
jgi:hypothetical protein